MSQRTISILSISLLVIGSNLTGFSQNSEEWKDIESLPSYNFFQELYNQPSARKWSPLLNEGIVEFGYSNNNRESYHLQQEGTEDRVARFYTDCTLEQKKTTVWGTASYSNTVKEDVEWSVNSDPFRIGPYVVADTIGGTFYGENYFLKGGVELPIWIGRLGVEASYDIKQEFQKSDPRPKNNIYDIEGKVGYSISLNELYRVGVGVSLGEYQQKCWVTTAESYRYDMFYSLKGFGLYDKHLSSVESTFSRTYEGSRYGANIFLHPTDNNSWHILGEFVSESIESLQDSRYPFLYSTKLLTAEVGYKMQINGSANTLHAKLDYTYYSGDGTERIYEYKLVDEDSDYYDYFLLSEAVKFQRRTHTPTLSILYSIDRDRANWWLECSATYYDAKQDYLSPSYFIYNSWIQADISIGTVLKCGNDALQLNVDHKLKTESTFTTQLPTTDSVVSGLILEDIATLEQAVNRTGVNIKYSSDILKDGKSLYLKGNTDILYNKNGSSWSYGVAIGYTL